MFKTAPTVSTPQDALRAGAFAGVFDDVHPGPFNATPGYTITGDHQNIAYKVNGELPPDGINEMWRQTYVDMSTPTDFGSNKQVHVYSTSFDCLNHRDLIILISR